jgi:predicted molibdopterin-dependent oxidoreductase YjgC
VERVEELQFQRPEAVIELSEHDAGIRTISTGDAVVVSSNGTTLALRASVNKALMDGFVRAAEEHVRGLEGAVEVSSASSLRSPEGRAEA